jgi:ribosome-binding factor A
MKARKTSNREIDASCSERRPDDGVDPRTFFRKPARRGNNRKDLQLCSQIARTLNSVMAWESGDDLLLCLSVESVVPAPDSTRVLVTVSVQSPLETAERAQILARLYGHAGRFRAEVGAAIHRKKVPELVFRVSGEGVRP